MEDYIIDSVFYYVPEELPDEPEELEWGDKVIVMARLEEENTNWVHEELPEYVLTSLMIFNRLSSCLKILF